MGTQESWVPMKFIFGKPTDDPFDREEEIRTLLNLINRKQPVSVIGTRRVGKTSILLKVLSSLNTPHIYISAEDFIEGKSFDLKSFLISFSGLIVSEVVKYLDTRRRIVFDIKNKGEKLITSLRDLIGYAKLSLNLNLVEVEMLLENKENLRETTREILELPQKMAETLGKDFVIVIDEFQYMRLAEQNLPGLMHMMRSKWQFHKNVEYVVSGSAVGILEKMFSTKTEPFYQFFYPTYVKPFSKEVSRLFLIKGFTDEGKEFDEKGIDIAVEELDGFPAWLNYFGLKALNCEKVDERCVKDVLNSMNQDPIIRNIVLGEYRKLSKNARAIFSFLVKKGGQGNLRGIGLNKSSINEGIKSLMGEGYILRVNRGVYKIVDPVFVKILAKED